MSRLSMVEGGEEKQGIYITQPCMLRHWIAMAHACHAKSVLNAGVCSSTCTVNCCQEGMDVGKQPQLAG